MQVKYTPPSSPKAVGDKDEHPLWEAGPFEAVSTNRAGWPGSLLAYNAGQAAIRMAQQQR